MKKSSQGTLAASGQDAEQILKLFRSSDRILVKKLSKNDREWARDPDIHQGGVYIPHEHRDAGFFLPLEEKDRNDPTKAKIFECLFTTIWPQLGGKEKRSRLVNYTSKGQETHMTRLPKALFGDLLPASFLVMGLNKGENGYSYRCLTIDSGSDEAAFLAELLDLDPDFLIGEFNPAEVAAKEREQILGFTEQVIRAWLAGTIDLFVATNATMPTTAAMAERAQIAFLERHQIEKTDPFAMERPGDALREISRSIEWNLFREFQRREKSVELIRIVLGDEPKAVQASDVIRRLIDAMPAIDALMLSASQQRKSRAGYSYEHHIEAMLIGGRIPYEKQVVIEARKRPDFILPSLKFLRDNSDEAGGGLILSAKTTLRERWKQVEREKGARNLYLTTVDENVASNAIEDMASFGVHLVIPEGLKESKSTEYADHENVISFKEFCENVVKSKLDAWR
jgi:hypothetical protein